MLRPDHDFTTTGGISAVHTGVGSDFGELGRASIRGQFNTLSPDDLRVVLIEGGERVLPNFDPELSAYTLDALKHLSADQKAVSDLDRRIQDQTELAEI